MGRTSIHGLAMLTIVAALVWACSKVTVRFDSPPTSSAGGAGTGSGSAGMGTGGEGNAGPRCGDGVIDSDEGEICDPPSTCPTSCDDADVCTTDEMFGSASSCDVVCGHLTTTCEPMADGCCPAECNGTNDPDCAVCGNFLVELGETCDSTCPSSCDDMNACTIDTQMGAAATCDMTCTNMPIMACTSNDGCCTPGCNPSTDNDCTQTVITVDHIHRGWWRDDGFHDAFNDSTLTGISNNDDHNSYVIFDLSMVTGTVLYARLRLEIESLQGSFSETLSVWDVTTNPASLEASGMNVAIFQDLQSGFVFGSFPVFLADVTTVKDIVLNAQALANIQAALGAQFAVGMHTETAMNNQWVGFSYASEPRTLQLVLDIIF